MFLLKIFEFFYTKYSYKIFFDLVGYKSNWKWQLQGDRDKTKITKLSVKKMLYISRPTW